MPSLEDLPIDVIIEIIKWLPDIPTLLHFIHASPVANSIFQQFAWQIFQAAKHNSPLQVRSLINTLTHIRASTLPFANRHQLLEKHGAAQTPATRRPFRQTPLPVLRGVMVTACHIQHLGGQILAELIGRCQTINAAHLVDSRGYVPCLYTRNMQIWYDRRRETRKCLARPYQPISNGGPPSEVEAERVYRVLWQLQISYELESAAREARLFWPADDIDKILRGGGRVEFWAETAGFQVEQFEAVRTCLERLYPNNNRAALPLYNGSNKYHWPVAEAADLEEFGHKGWEDGIRCLGIPSPGTRIANLVPYAGASRILKRVWCHYGFAIWDKRRLAVLELLNPPVGISELGLADPEMFRSNEDIVYTWISIFM